jgi:hypothetical protein
MSPWSPVAHVAPYNPQGHPEPPEATPEKEALEEELRRKKKRKED